MKDYFLSMIVFLAVLLLGTNFAYSRYQHFEQQKIIMQGKQVQAEITSKNIEYKGAQLKAQLGDDDPAAFEVSFGQTLRSMQDVAQIAQSINRQAESLLIPIQEQRTGDVLLPGRPGSNITQISAHTYTISLLGQFKDCLTWLGVVEDMYPMARIEHISMTPSGELINLRCSLVFPRVDPTVISSK
ncbi:MAG: hypothetical protein JW739_07440 [Opitutales bacterium]|nr:hypothetical protein [Opitutales bacterium]